MGGLERYHETLQPTPPGHALNVIDAGPATGVTTVHDLDAWINPSLYPLWYRVQWLRHKRFLRGSRLVGISRQSRMDAEALGYGLHRIIEPYVAKPVSSSLRRGDWYLMVGTSQPRKRYELCLEAVPVGSRVVWAGEASRDSHSQGYEAFVRKRAFSVGVQLERRYGPQDAALGNLYATCKALLVAGRHEGYCLPIIEATSHGCPVILGRAEPWVSNVYGPEWSRMQDDPTGFYHALDAQKGWSDKERFLEAWMDEYARL